MDSPSTSPAGDGGERPRPSRRGWIIGGIIVVVLLVATLVPALLFGDDDDGLDFSRPDTTPEDVLKEAKEKLDETEGVEIALTSQGLTDDVSTALVSAQGTAVRPDGFSGAFALRAFSLPVDVDIVATEGTTYARAALLGPGWREVEPEDYNAPDPGTLLDPDAGVSGILTATQDPVEDGEERCGEATATRYTGTVPAETVRNIIPGADGDFDAVYLVDEGGFLCRADLTGEFYTDVSLTYEIGFSNYGETIEITAP
ncbi:LppX_LprAFG lipoprotein [Nocardioides sp. ChNu-153]|uniref:LppX_LprAFG lipoprotein n=1 Tax=unclassified Nocardioides TaxID=2615069 RepID=UPI0024054572|nr:MULTISPECIES: LppX_LprAFG lipoprotein [unclassified Nocardioides]MDF9715572.1 LppX_LprAFG lipoprotein [Nocardioides sp. ChNu-99]MDN7121244.1 LppX_LprAFG lipoprotein [Nocardioides sp. ChNu-153]